MLSGSRMVGGTVRGVAMRSVILKASFLVYQDRVGRGFLIARITVVTTRGDFIRVGSSAHGVIVRDRGVRAVGVSSSVCPPEIAMVYGGIHRGCGFVSGGRTSLVVSRLMDRRVCSTPPSIVRGGGGSATRTVSGSS